MTESDGDAERPAEVTHHNIDVATTIVQPAKQVLFTVSRSDIKVTLMEHLQRISGNSGWAISAPLFAVILLTLGTSSFHAFMNIPADTWQAVYVILLLASGIHAICSGIKFLRNRPLKIDELVARCISAGEPKE